jgi:peptide/nickel transport system substrate-binding protein
VGNKKKYLALGGAAILLLSVAACGSNRDDDSGDSSSTSESEPYTVGTTDTVTALDPAGSYDLGSSTLQYSVFQTLLTIPAGENTPQGDAAESCTYGDPQTLTCTLKEGLKFSNGNDLTSSDVKYSFERALTIADANGAAIYLLGSIGKVVDGLATWDPSAIETPDDTTVIFHLNKPDTTLQYVLTYPGAGAIVDEDTFPLDEKLPDADVIGSGPYKVSDYKAGEQATLELNDEYTGDREGKAPQVFVSYYQDPGALKLAVEDGDVDIAYRSLSPTDVNDLKTNDSVTVAEGAGAEIRYWVAYLGNPEPKQLAVRQAFAQIIDRQAIADTAYDGTVDPLYSIVPSGLAGSNEAFKEKYGDAPDVEAAKQTLEDAGISTPVSITLGYTPTHYGPNAIDEATEVQRQLEESGLFKVKVSSTEWEQYQTIAKEGAYDFYSYGWFPDFLDADNYLAPFMVDGGFFQNKYTNPDVNDLVASEQASSDQDERQQIFGELQNKAAEDVPFIPSWVGKNTAVYGAGMEGVEDTLDPSFIFRFWIISKNS